MINITYNSLDAIMQRALDALMIDCADFDDARIFDIIDTCDYDDSLIAYALCDIIDNARTHLAIDDATMMTRIAATRARCADYI